MDLQSNPPHTPYDDRPHPIHPPGKEGRLLPYGGPVDEGRSSGYLSFAKKPTTTMNHPGKISGCPPGYAWNTISQQCEG